MMSVLQYADDINRTVDEVLKKCQELGIAVSNSEDILDEEAIIELDNAFNNEIDEDEHLDDIVESIMETEQIKIDDSVKKEKLKKKSNISNTSNKKKEFAIKKKAMYKNKEKLQTNFPINNDQVILYKEGMSIKQLELLLILIRVSQPMCLVEETLRLGQ